MKFSGGFIVYRLVFYHLWLLEVLQRILSKLM